MSIFEKYALLINPVSFERCSAEINQRKTQKLQALENELAALEVQCPGKLCWRHRKSNTTFWIYHKGKQHGITREKDKIYSLARKAFLQVSLDDLYQYDNVEWANSINDLLQSFSSAGLDLHRIILTKAQYEWTSNPQSQNIINRENLRYQTTNGVFVRSKSEQFIGNLLESLGIPYRYEPEMRIGNRIFHPDFVIMTADDRKIILEHFGRMDLKEYVSANIDRLMAFNSHGLLIGRDVFISFESDIASREKFMLIINQIMAS